MILPCACNVETRLQFFPVTCSLWPGHLFTTEDTNFHRKNVEISHSGQFFGRVITLCMSTGWSKKDGTFILCAIEKPEKGFLNITKTCALYHGNFFDISLNIVSSAVWRSEIIKQSTYFPLVQFFFKNLQCANFELYVNPGGANMQHLFKLSGIGQMPLYKCRNTMWCALSGQDEGGGDAVR